MIETDLCSFDVETTGVNPETDRIVTAFVGIHNPDGTLRRGRAWLIDPEIEIPREATAIHGITTIRAREDGQSSPRALMEIEADLAAAVALGIPLVVMNAPFDLTMLDREIGRHFDRGIGFDPRPVIDPLVLDKQTDAFRPGGRTLTSLCKHHGIELDDAHTADADATATAMLVAPLLVKVDEIMAAKGYPSDAVTLDNLHQWQIKWREQQTDHLIDYWRSIGKAVDDADHPRDWPIVPRSIMSEGIL